MIVVLLSGGRDSVCLLDLLVERGERVTALHVNYGLRPSADADEAFCRALCERLGVPLVVHRPGPPEGNVQAWARAVRYEQAARLGPVVATGHTATDQVETVLYRLAASPGRRALLGIRERPGVIRPLLGWTREETAAYCRERGLAWREDPTNESDAFARNRIRNELLPALRAIHPAAEANLLRTLEILRDEAEVLDALIDTEPSVSRIAALPPALRRLTVQAIAGGVGGGGISARTDEILALGSRGGTATLDLGGGLRAVVEYGRLRFDHGPPAAPEPARLTVPGAVAFGAGRVICELAPDGPLDAGALAPELEVRPWRAGDRLCRRTLQDRFTDLKLPREQRHQLPVVVSDGDIAWAIGIVGERFRATASTERRVRLTWEA